MTIGEYRTGMSAWISYMKKETERAMNDMLMTGWAAGYNTDIYDMVKDAAKLQSALSETDGMDTDRLIPEDLARELMEADVAEIAYKSKLIREMYFSHPVKS